MNSRLAGLMALVLALSAAGTEDLPAPQVPDEVVAKGLHYLASRQNQNGSWGTFNTVGLTSGACLALMASGTTWGRGPYSEQVQAGLKYLIACQEPHGCFIDRNSMSWTETHNHGYGMLCLAQAYGMVPEEVGEKMLPVLRKAVKASLGSQSDNGGWGYGILQQNYLNGFKDEGSCSVTQLQALRACREIGIDVSEKAIKAAIAYVEKCVHKETGGFVYSLGGQTVGCDPSLGKNLPHFGVTAAMLSTLNAAGSYHSELEGRSLAYLDAFLEGKHQVKFFFYYGNFYAAQAYFQAGESPFRRYWSAMAPEIIKRQREDGSFPGEDWMEADPQYGSPLMTTSFALLVLQVPNQYLPIFQR